MSLLTASVVKSSHNVAGIYFIFLKKAFQAIIERLSMPNLDFSK